MSLACFDLQHDDVLHPLLTIYETLYYTAMLRLPRAMSKREKAKRVEAVILTLGLQSCRDSSVGGGFGSGGPVSGLISGGQRKRVSIGVEILLNPTVILLGESMPHRQT